jgi:hypothetical protein
MSDQSGMTVTITPGQLARAQTQRRKGKPWGEMTRKEQKHLIDMARATLLAAKEIAA